MIKPVIFALIMLMGCAPKYSRIASNTSQIASKQGLSTKTYQTKNFKIFTLQKITDKNQTVRIYFEGDGRALINSTLASINPTPTSYFLTTLISKDPHPNIVYIARPCQFVDDKKCKNDYPEKYWTSDRFSKEVLDSINEVVKDFSGYRLELVGYSGGATVLHFVAAYNQHLYGNVVNIRTIAGDFSGFEKSSKKIKLNATSSLGKKYDTSLPIVADLTSADTDKVGDVIQESLDDLSNKNSAKTADKEVRNPHRKVSWKRLVARIPQIHFVGNQDDIISKDVVENYVKNLPRKNCAKIVAIDKADHESGWKSRWQKLLEDKPTCNRAPISTNPQ
ncbi:MAG: putative Esterase/lipase/thioesterase [Rickettsiaceae bacterium]|jgi:hypothetical protein|nr:putative Esterase/lipase/thioesterase [Rickettsiaceae bacterium]